MTALDSAARVWWDWMWPMTWQVAVLAAAVLVVTLLARRRSAHLRYWLWCLVLVKVCLPPSLAFVTGVGALLPMERATTPPAATAPVAAMPAPLPTPTPAEFAVAPEPVLAAPQLEATSHQVPMEESPVAVPQKVPAGHLFAAWAAGLLAMAVLLALQYFLIRRRVARGTMVTDATALALLAEARAALGIRRPVGLVAAEDMASPVLFGLVRPRIVLPASALALSADQLRPILLHELAHLRRRDLWVNWAQAVLQAVYWFHPAVWLANGRLRRERELIVDDMVLARLGGEREAYGASLVSVLKHAARRRMLSPGYVGIAEPHGSVAARVRRILDAQRRLSLRLGLPGAALVLALALVLIPQGRAATAPPPKEIAVVRWMAATDEAGADRIRKLCAPLAVESSSHEALSCDGPALDAALAEMLKSGQAFVSPASRLREDTRGRVADTLTADYNGELAGQRVWGNFVLAGNYELRREDAGARLDLEYNGVTLKLRCQGLLAPGRAWVFLKKSDAAESAQLLYHLSVWQAVASADAPVGAMTRDTDGPQWIQRHAQGQLAASPSPFQAKLPNGVTVELVGVSYHPSDGKQWWRPDGPPLAEAPYDSLGTGLNGMARELAVRLGVGEREDISTTLQLDPCDALIPNDSPVRAGRPVPGVRAVSARFAAGQTTVAVRVGVAAGQWQTLQHNDYPTGGAVDWGSDYRVIVQEVSADKGGGSQVTYAFVLEGQKAKMARRLVAVDTSGALHAAVGGGNEAGGFGLQTGRFEGLAPDRIKGIRFEVRPYEWVEFRNVSLEPGQQTKVETIVEGEAPGTGTSDAAKQQLMALVEDFFKHNFRDVTARETIEWGDVQTDEKGNRSIRYKYGATIWDKDVMTMNQVFTFDPKGGFVKYENVEGYPQKVSGAAPAAPAFKLLASDGSQLPADELKQRLMALVEDFFAHNFRDISARKTIEWGDVKRDDKGNYSIRYKYEARSWGAPITADLIFTFDPTGRYVSCDPAQPIPPFRTYTVDKAVSDFPPGEDLSTPEAAYATLNRLSATGDQSFWRRLSEAQMRGSLPAGAGKPQPVAEDWKQALLGARILQVHVCADKFAGVVAQLPGPTIRQPFDLRCLALEEGRWLNAGNERFDTAEAARIKFGRICALRGLGAAAATPEPRAAESSADKVGQAAAFGPVIERVVNVGSGAADTCIDLDSGRLFSLPADLDVRGQAAMASWYRKMGVDAAGEMGLSVVLRNTKVQQGVPDPGASVRGLVLLDTAATAVPDASWEAPTEAAVLRRIMLGTAAQPIEWPVGIMVRDGAPTTYDFKTREGGVGILHIVGSTEDPVGIRIRYKMAAPPSAAPPPAAGSRKAEENGRPQPTAFSSAVAFDVYAVTDEKGCQLVGHTPSDGPLTIPPCLLWYVEPRVPVDMANVRQEVEAQGIAGLMLRDATDADIEHLEGLAGLRYLDLPGTQVADAGLAHLEGLTGLEQLDLAGTKVTDAGLQHIEGLTSLQRLDLSGTQVTDAGLEHLKGLTALQGLNLWYVPVTGTGLAHLKGLKALQLLVLTGTKVTDSGLVYLKDLTALQWLYLGGTQVTDAGLEHLEGLTELHYLELFDTQVTGAGLGHLKGLGKLRNLDLAGTQVTDQGLVDLKDLTALRWLRLDNTRVTDAGLANLEGLTGLQYLFLSETQVTDAGLAHLEGLIVLQRLDLERTQVTDAGLEHLKGLTALHVLSIAGTKVTAAGVERLKTSLPNLDVLR